MVVKKNGWRPSGTSRGCFGLENEFISFFEIALVMYCHMS